MSKYIQALIFTVLFFGIGFFMSYAIMWAIETLNPLMWVLIGIMVVPVYLQMLKSAKEE